jgi:hypothetical protein
MKWDVAGKMSSRITIVVYHHRQSSSSVAAVAASRARRLACVDGSYVHSV